MNKTNVFAVLLLLVIPAFAPGEEEKPKALPSSVVAYDAEQGFRLTDAAIARLGVRFQELKGDGTWSIPKSALVKVKRSTGVYRQVDGFITLILIEQVRTDGDLVNVRSEDLRAGDRIAVAGSGYLRVVELDLAGGGGDSCGG